MVNNKLFSLSLIFAVVLLLAGCDNRKVSSGSLLDSFSRRVETLHPEDSLVLEDLGILLPSDIYVYDNHFVIRKGRSKNAVDILNPKTRKVIHCLNVGRGPGEVTAPNLSFSGDDMYVLDGNSDCLLRVNIKETISRGMQSFDLIREYNNLPKFVRVGAVYKHEGKDIALGWFENDVWFGLLDSTGVVTSGVPYIDFESLRDAARITKGAFFEASNISIRPKGDKLVCALSSAPAISICDISDNEIKEEHRLVWGEPLIQDAGDLSKGGMVLIYDKKNKKAFGSVASDDKHIYLLYSGKEQGEPYAYESEHLLVLDWNGKPLKHVLLSEPVCDMTLKDGTLYCTTTIPPSRILMYKLDI